jgi:hypothetical protein
LVDLADALKEQAPDAIRKIHAKTKGTSFLAAGIPEVTEVILALGSSGAVIALQSILKSYFSKRPKAELIFRKKGKLSSTEIIVRNADTASLKVLFENINNM